MKLKLVLIVILTVSELGTQAQSIQQSLSMADDFLLKEDYQEAEALYERVFFFADDDSIRHISCLKMAQVLEKQMKFYDAAQYYAAVTKIGFVEEQELTTYKLLAALYLLKENKADEVIALLDSTSLDEEKKDSSYYKKVLFMGLAAVLVQNKRLANTCFSLFYPLLSKNDSLKLAGINKKMLAAKPRNEKIALITSLVLPGAGQTLNGDYKNGANSFLLNTTMIGLSLYTAVTYNWVNGLLVAGLLLPRYYIGGANMAAEAANQHNKVAAQNKMNEYISFFKSAAIKIE